MTIKRCYILGAGFSKACGLPLASELTALVFNHMHEGLRNSKPEIVADRRAFVQTLYPQCDLQENWPDFEDLITVLDEWDDYRRACGGDDVSYSFVRNLRQNLTRYLGWLLCERATSANTAGKLGTVQRFLRKVHDERSRIVSFNWDLLLEIAAQNLDLRIRYKSQTTTDGVLVARPHGSLNLAYVERKKWEEWQDPVHKPINVFGLDVEWGQNEDVVVRAQNPCDAINRIWAVGGALIVPPTVKKSYELGWVNRQWHLALDIVRNANEVIIIGYSLPPTDIRPRLLLQLASFGRDTNVVLKFIDPKAGELKGRFSRFLSAPITIIEKQWQDALSEM